MFPCLGFRTVRNHSSHSCRGSLLSPRLGEDVDANVQRLRKVLRGMVKGAWSQEALRRGISHAKAGDTPAALACYDQVGK